MTDRVYKDFLSWLERINQSTPSPEDIVAFNFGLFESTDGYSVYLVCARCGEVKSLMLERERAHAISLLGHIPYTLANGDQRVATLPTLRLSPGEVKKVNLSAISQSAQASAADLEFNYTGSTGSVISILSKADPLHGVLSIVWAARRKRYRVGLLTPDSELPCDKALHPATTKFFSLDNSV
jgi:hypothetical protein